MKWTLGFALVCLFCLRAFAADQDTSTLRVAVLSVDTEQISAYSEWAVKFESAHPEISLTINYYSDKAYKTKLNTWLEDGTYDLVYWQSGERLASLVDKQLIVPISGILDPQILRNNIPDSVLQQVTYKNQVYALPFAQYTWGFYYNKRLFERHSLSPPRTWQELLEVANTLQQKGVSPFIQANIEGWPILAWLDYLSFKVGGVDLRNKLLKNNLNTMEEAKLLEEFRLFIDKDYFLSPESPLIWQQTISLVGREQAAMTLMGQFAESILSHRMSDRIGFFNFPEINGSTLAMTPLEVFLVPESGSNVAATKLFLEYLLTPKHQTELSLSLGWLPVNLQQINSADVNYRQQTAIDYLNKTTDRIQYFDRESTEEIAKNFSNSLIQMLETKTTAPLANVLNGQTVNAELIAENPMLKPIIRLAAIHGHKGTYLASSMLRDVYKSIGFDLAITRFVDTQDAMQSYEQGIDGDLLRAKIFENETDQLLRIPEPLFTAKMYLLTRGDTCDNPALIRQRRLKVGVSSDALVYRQWANDLGITLQRYKTLNDLWDAYERKEILHVLGAWSDVPQTKRNTPTFCKSVQMEAPLFHYVHKRHSNLVRSLNNALKEYKSSEAYTDTLQRYGVSQ